jgi:hypothetical protein
MVSYRRRPGHHVIEGGIMALRGAAVRNALSAVLDAVTDLLPAGVSVTVTPLGPGCDVTASGPAGGSGSMIIALGAWIPFLPADTDIRINAEAALEIVQHAIRTASGEVWPGGRDHVSATVGSDVVILTFADDDGQRPLTLPALSRTLFQRE